MKINLKEIPTSGLAAMLTKYETEYFIATEKHSDAWMVIENLLDEAETRGVNLLELYKNERRI